MLRVLSPLALAFCPARDERPPRDMLRGDTRAGTSLSSWIQLVVRQRVARLKFKVGARECRGNLAESDSDPMRPRAGPRVLSVGRSWRAIQSQSDASRPHDFERVSSRARVARNRKRITLESPKEQSQHTHTHTHTLIELESASKATTTPTRTNWRLG